MKTIQLFTAQDVTNTWMAAHMDESSMPDQSIVALFGTHILPTPFSGTAPYEMVLELVQTNNPGYNVVLS